MARLSRSSLVFAILLLVFPLTSFAQNRGLRAPVPAIYFDLGDVLVETKDARGFFFTPGAADYLKASIVRGHALRLITNIPESWGRTQPEKFEALKKYIASKWIERQPFPWHIFDLVILPPNDQLRKPHPHMFLEAMKAAGPCRPVFQGEDPGEVDVAKQLGFLSYLVAAHLHHGKPAFAPLDELYCRPYQPEVAFRRFLFNKRGF